MRRIPHLDVLRGIAMLGILPVNLLYFGMPFADQFPIEGQGADAADVAAFGWITVAHELKFITLFSLLFGAGMALAYRRVGEEIEPYANVMLRRLLVLLPIGVLHGIFLWQGDVLSTYAPLGLMLCWFVVVPRVGQWLLALGGIAGSLALLAAASLYADPGESWQDGWVIEAYATGTYWEVVQARASDWVFVWISGLFVFGGRLGGCFLIGMAVVQSGWLERVRELRRGWVAAASIGICVGLVGEWGAWELGREVVNDGAGIRAAATEGLHYLSSFVLAAGYAAVVVLLVETGTDARTGPLWTRPFAAVGRTAFTNYILQSVCMNVVFLPALLGRYDQLSHVELLQLAVVVWIGQLVLSMLWLRWFRIGPLEWAWRSITYWRVERLLRE